MVLGGTQVLPGDCRVAIAHKMNVLESLGKVVFGPLTPRGGVWGGSSPPHSRAYLVPLCLEGGLGGPSPHFRDKIGPLEQRGGFGGILPPF